jgi:probable HAF family extracellular repeat protein
MKKLLFITTALTTLSLYSASANAALTDIGIAISSDFSTNARGVSADGSTIVGAGPDFAYKYSATDGMLHDLGALPGHSDSHANAISADGSTIVGYSEDRAFKYAYDETDKVFKMTDLGDLDPDFDSFYTEAYGVSADGSIIVGTSDNGNGNRAFKYAYDETDKVFKMTDIGDLDLDPDFDSFSEAYGVSADGSIIVGASDNGNNYRAFKYAYDETDKAFKMTDIGDLDLDPDLDSLSIANAISADGSTIVGQSYNGYYNHAFKYIGGVMTDLGTLTSDGSGDSFAYDVSADGSTIVGQSYNGGYNHAFKYVDGVMTGLGTLNSNGSGHSTAYGVSADGSTIVGESNYEGGASDEYHTFMVKTDVNAPILVDVNNTYTSLYYNGAQLYSLMNLKNALLKNSLNQDCDKFGVNNVCASVGYRYANVNNHNAQEHAANLKMAYRFTPSFRTGIIIDQSFASKDPQNFEVENSQPLFGVFVNIGQSRDESGFNLKLAASYNDTKMSVTRNVLVNTEAGEGNTNLTSSGILAELSYAAKVADKLQIKPFVGIRKTEISRDGFTETAGATFPITFATVKQKFTSATLGAKAKFDLTKKTELNFSTGLEHSLSSTMDGYSGVISGIDKTFNLNSPDYKKTTGFVETGVSYDLGKSTYVSGGVNYATQALNNAKTTTIYLNYTVGF